MGSSFGLQMVLHPDVSRLRWMTSIIYGRLPIWSSFYPVLP
jgi:hypothetical protein